MTNNLEGPPVSDIREALMAMKHSALRNYVTPGLTSHLIGGAGFGCVRMFSSDRDTRHWITPHSHRFDFVCLVLRGSVENIKFQRGGGNAYCRGTLTPKNGGLGGYSVDREDKPDYYVEYPSVYRAGDTYKMRSTEIHSIRFGRDTEVLFFEGPQVSETSVILEPWSNGKCVQTFETAPWMFERDKPSGNAESKA